MSLSSNSLIHLTKKKESLIGILNNNFKVQYCLEHIRTKNGAFKGAFPMVCFCDIPLSEIKNHIFLYGDYGIGLSKGWAKSRGLNPILYIEEQSDIGAEFRTHSKLFFDKAKETKTIKSFYPILNLFRYMKNYEVLEEYGLIRYSDEREWRYVPPTSDAPLLILPDKFSTQEDKDKINTGIQHLKLEFTPDDITYIIIKDESEIFEFIDVLVKAKGKKYTHEQVERLKTRIITIDQIKYDF